jgi:riboflavin transporter FmnP
MSMPLLLNLKYQIEETSKWAMLMKSKSIALMASFAAVAIALNVVKVPVFYLPGLSYTPIEIPVVVAFLLFGFKIGVLVEVLHVVGQILFFPAGPAGFAVYPMGMLAVLLMFVGVYFASRFLTRKVGSKEAPDRKKTLVFLTAFAAVFRGGLMPLIDYGLLYHILLPLFLGTNIPEAYIVGLVPGFVLYNLTVALYTIPIAYIIATKMSSALTLQTRFLKQI